MAWVRFGDHRGAGRIAGVIDWRSDGSGPGRPTRDDPFLDCIVVDHPDASCPPQRPMIVVRTVEWAEQALSAGEIGCPHPGCGGTLTRWGYGRHRRIRSLGAQTLDVRPRRARCTGCAGTQILLPAAVQPRLADTTEVIGTALASKAAGHGHRHIATSPPSSIAHPRPCAAGCAAPHAALTWTGCGSAAARPSSGSTLTRSTSCPAPPTRCAMR